TGRYDCSGFQHAQASRRDLLRIGGLGLLGLSLPGLLQAAGGARKAKAKSVIFLHQWGGPSHVDTFDMKPNAPAEVRGEFKAMPPSAPGIPVCELLRRTAKVMDKVTLVRSLHHQMKNHNSAGYYCLTGHAPPLEDQRLRDTLDLYPAYGSVV